MNVLSVEAEVALMTKVRSISGILAEFRRKEEISYHDHCTKSSSQNLKVRTNLIPSLKRTNSPLQKKSFPTNIAIYSVLTQVSVPNL